MKTHAELLEDAQRWLREDPDPGTRAELEAMLERDDEHELREAFGARLEFGTAGLRGILGPGPNRMNRALVRKVTLGLARYLKRAQPDVARRGVVVGNDARRLSPELADDTARVLGGAGILVHRFEAYAPTPLLAFAVGHLGAAGGVVVTASHNPPEYNGYKVYWDNGAQIIPPHDSGISTAIDQVGSLSEVDLPELEELRDGGRLLTVSPEVEESYLAAIAALQRYPELPRSEVGVVYTPLHGVGGQLVRRALQAAGVERLHVVPAQSEPDGAFPTVRFPNPEEEGALDLALALARQHDADLILANDPDADRLAVAAPDREGGYPLLTGNEIGSVLGYYLLTERLPEETEPLVMTTIVSSRLLARMADELGAHYDETLTGFKWIANRARTHLSEAGWILQVGYEEALGYSIGLVTPDKDGISAALLMTEVAALCRSRGMQLWDYVESIYRRFGLYRSRQHSVTLPGIEGAARIEATLSALRAKPPQSFGGSWRIARSLDFKPGLQGLPPSNVLAYELEGGGRVLVRPSGTEPKIKYYFELVEAIGADEPFGAARDRVEGRLDALVEAFLAEVDARH